MALALLLVLISLSNAQTAVSLVSDTKILPPANIVRTNAGFHLLNDSSFLLVVNERANLALTSGFPNNITIYVVNQNYSILTSSTVYNNPLTFASASTIDVSGSIIIFGYSTDTMCPPLIIGSQTNAPKGFVMKISSSTSAAFTWCRSHQG